MHAELVCTALQLAIAQRRPAPGMLVHSDRGSQYASALHQALLERHGLVGSMSRKGNCWDNSVMERFFLSLKTERVWQRDYANHAEAMTDIADYIVGFYNSVRLHSKLGNLPLNASEQKSAIKLPIAVSGKPGKAQFKLDLLQSIALEKISRTQACIRFGLRGGTGVIAAWQRQYHEGGIDALKAKRKGRPPNMKTNKPASAPAPSNSTHSDTPDAQRSLQDVLKENEYLRAEVAYLKKLRALRQEKEQAAQKKRG